MELTIRQLQVNLPWTIKYSEDFRSTPLAHKDFNHALHHVSKAAGRLHELADNMDHNRAVALDTAPISGTRAVYGKYVADLVVCALRIANVFPNGVLDLQKEVQDRIETKNDVKLPNVENSVGTVDKLRFTQAWDRVCVKYGRYEASGDPFLRDIFEEMRAEI